MSELEKEKSHSFFYQNPEIKCQNWRVGAKKNTAELNKRDIEKMEEGRDQKWQLRKMMSFCIVGHLKVI